MKPRPHPKYPDRTLSDAALSALAAMRPEEWATFIPKFNSVFRWGGGGG